jgi:hypothetical protein
MIKLIRNSAAIKHSLTGTVLTLGLLMTGTSQASAATIGATLTADNSYGLYYGEADGSGGGGSGSGDRAGTLVVTGAVTVVAVAAATVVMTGTVMMILPSYFAVQFTIFPLFYFQV